MENPFTSKPVIVTYLSIKRIILKKFIGNQIQVNKYQKKDVISELLNQLNVEQLVSNGSILNISIQNASSQSH